MDNPETVKVNARMMAEALVEWARIVNAMAKAKIAPTPMTFIAMHIGATHALAAMGIGIEHTRVPEDENASDVPEMSCPIGKNVPVC